MDCHENEPFPKKLELSKLEHFKKKLSLNILQYIYPIFQQKMKSLYKTNYGFQSNFYGFSICLQHMLTPKMCIQPIAIVNFCTLILHFFPFKIQNILSKFNVCLVMLFLSIYLSTYLYIPGCKKYWLLIIFLRNWGFLVAYCDLYSVSIFSEEELFVFKRKRKLNCQ